MRIVSRAEFLTLPAGTVFSKYKPSVFGDLQIKGASNAYNDFWYQQIVDSLDCEGSHEFFDLLEESEKTGRSLLMDFETETRDGMFDDEQLFSVWEREDVMSLINRLLQAVLTSTAHPQERKVS